MKFSTMMLVLPVMVWAGEKAPKDPMQPIDWFIASSVSAVKVVPTATPKPTLATAEFVSVSPVVAPNPVLPTVNKAKPKPYPSPVVINLPALKSMVLQGVSIIGSLKIATISGREYEVGDTIQEYSVARIESRYVVLSPSVGETVETKTKRLELNEDVSGINITPVGSDEKIKGN